MLKDNQNEIRKVFYCDGGHAVSRGEYPCYGSFRWIETRFNEDGTEEFIVPGKQTHIVHKANIHTNNQAEIATFICLLKHIKENWDIKDGSEIMIRLDSEFVVKVLGGRYRTTNEGLVPLFKQAQTLLDVIPYTIKITWVMGKVMKIVLGH